MDAWHFINKTSISIYFIKFPDLSLKYHSDLYSYRKNQDYVYWKGSTLVLGKNEIRFDKYSQTHRVEKHHINYLHKLLAENETYIILITIIHHYAWSFNITFAMITSDGLKERLIDIFLARNKGKKHDDSVTLSFIMKSQTPLSLKNEPEDSVVSYLHWICKLRWQSTESVVFHRVVLSWFKSFSPHGPIVCYPEHD